MTAIPSPPTLRQFIIGALCAMTTMSIWAGWNVMSRMGVNDAQLTPYDIVFLRFAVAGSLAIPLFIRYLPFYRSIPLYYSLVMICGSGAIYVLLASFGFVHAPASHGALIPGFMLLCVAVLSSFWLKEEINSIRKVGYVLIACTILFRLISDSVGIETLQSDGWFMLAGVFWAFYTVVNKRTGISPLQALALVCTGSAIMYCLPYLALNYDRISNLPLQGSALQMLYQGIVVSYVAFFCYNKAIGLIGPSRASAFAAAIPILTILIAMPVLGEVATPADWWFAGLLTIGVLLSTGALRRIFGLR